MIALIQRVTGARVAVDENTIAKIGTGLLALIGVEREDGPAQASRLAQRLLAYRLFADGAGKMNLNVVQNRGGLLLVPQFTLAADTNSGNRPSFTPAATPEKGRELFDLLVTVVREQYGKVETGRFGADMQVSLTNDGPVTFRLRVN